MHILGYDVVVNAIAISVFTIVVLFQQQPLAKAMAVCLLTAEAK
jgi:hypothetical protein